MKKNKIFQVSFKGSVLEADETKSDGVEVVEGEEKDVTGETTENTGDESSESTEEDKIAYIAAEAMDQAIAKLNLKFKVDSINQIVQYNELAGLDAPCIEGHVYVRKVNDGCYFAFPVTELADIVRATARGEVVEISSYTDVASIIL